MNIRDKRIQYETAGLDRDDLSDDPFEQFALWYQQADEAGIAEPHAMVVSTVDPEGMPDSRAVLARSMDSTGFTFFTNYESAKSAHLHSHPVAAALFPWFVLHRQVRLRGAVERVSEAESDDYFASRPRGSQIGAWASAQSMSLDSRETLEERVARFEAQFGDDAVPRPPQWGGWRIVPEAFEFWQGRPSRLHDRFVYTKQANGLWQIARLYP
jgi:pyridoxamine 5'-phosphate oxidase